jgi:phosphate acetyltransferase
LRRHPKRVVFTEGEDIRVIEAAGRLVREEVVAPILLGNRERIRAMAAETWRAAQVHPHHRSAERLGLRLFCQRVENMARYRTMQLGQARGNRRPAALFRRADGAIRPGRRHRRRQPGDCPPCFFRALIHTIKPLPDVPKIFGFPS